jgi:thioredoxin-related protein
MRRRLIAAVTFVAVFSTICCLAGGDAARAEGGVRWLTPDAAKAMAKKTGKIIMLSFYATWCGYCKKMERETYSDPAVVKALNDHFLPALVDGDEQPDLARIFAVRGFPTMVFTDPNGRSILTTPGYRPPEQFLALLKYVYSGMYKKMSFDSFFSEGFAKRYVFPAPK